MITEYLNKVMDIYLQSNSKHVDRNSEEYQLLCQRIPELLREEYGSYHIVGSVGKGNKTDYPWICIMDPTITISAQKGLYIAILFRKNMEGFYITLNQGITYFENTFKKQKYIRAQEAAKYFRKEINIDGVLETIDLNGKKSDLGYGYEQTTVIGNYFEKGQYTKEKLYKILNEYIELYKEIIEQIDGSSYESIIPKIVNDPSLQYYDANKAIEEMNEVIFPGTRPIQQTLTEVKPQTDKVKRFKNISAPSNNKIDYVKRASDNAKTGLLGEKLILSFEIDRLNKIGLSDYIEKVKHVSLENDVLGYDILSFDKDDMGNIHEIYIEVKTTSNKKDVDFYVSKNEVEQSKILNKNYWLYRVYDCTTSNINPKFYRVNGPIPESFDLTADTYMATIKKDAKIISSNIQKNKALTNTIQAINVY